jgi:hypothetical protein
MISSKSRKEGNDLFLANPDLQLARDVWNLMENKMIMKMLEITLPSI